MDLLFNGTFFAQKADINWSKEDPDEGVFSYLDPHTRDLILQDVTHARVERTGEGKVAPGGGKVVLVRAQDMKDVSSSLHRTMWKARIVRLFDSSAGR